MQVDILLVSGSQSCIESVQRAFEGHGSGTTLSVARSLSDARRFLATIVPDAVIADSDLSDGRGLDLVSGEGELGPFPLLLLAEDEKALQSSSDLPPVTVEPISRANHALAAMPRIVNRILCKWQLARQHRQAADKCWRLERLVKAITDNVSNVLYVRDAQSERIVLASRAGLQLINLQSSDNPGEPSGSTLESQPFAELDRQALEQSVPISRDQETIATPVGDRIMRTRRVPIVDQRGRPELLLGVAEDITDRIKAEAAFQESEQRYRDLVNSLNEGVALVDKNEIVQFCNPALAEVFDFDTPAELVHRSLLDFIPGRQRVTVEQENERRRQGESSRYELDITTVLGRQKRIMLSVSPRFASGQYCGSLALVLDVSTAQATGDEVSASAQKDSPAAVVAEIAHDFNNVLYAISGNISLAKEDQAGRPDTLVLLEQAEVAIERAEQIVRKLHNQVDSPTSHHRTDDVASVIGEVTRQVLMGSAVSLSLSVPDNLPPVAIEECQVYRILNNLLANAVDAMPDGGRLSVSCSVDMARETISGVTPDGAYLRLTIADTGLGIPDSRLERIFEPYFTTKVNGRGVGLASVRSIVAECRGRITVDSRLGHGTTFTILLPLALTANELERPARDEGASRGGLIMVVDPDEDIRHEAAAILRYLNYEPLLVKTARAALDRVGSIMLSDQPVDVVVIDEKVVADETDESAVTQLHRIDPDLIIILAGNSDLLMVHEPERFGCQAIMNKPFRSGAFDQVLAELLKGKVRQ
ncbi:MAG: ATP-binding protein [candidate division Zixibacteria bacterium]|nr:ATP-binding protein [candidate division Zixibacteria bacterium]MDH3936559.1 ATP-binding protein [candidate division Zixibacteria bacterium]MDH4033145.1 ATP-binding protein [candidate division Zixibacteria bacterium]